MHIVSVCLPKALKQIEIKGGVLKANLHTEIDFIVRERDIKQE